MSGKKNVRFPLLALCLLSFTGGLLTGCRGSASVSKSEEEHFKNPPKQMPKEAVEYMKQHGKGQPTGTQ